MNKAIILCFSAITLIACQSNNKETKTTAISEEVQQVEENSLSATANASLYLNQGEAWEINEEMKPFLQKAEKILNTFKNNIEDTDYESLSLVLTEQNNLLIKSCTMDGEAHDVLHEWLVPHLEWTTALENAKSQEEAEKIIKELDYSFEDFHTFFK